MVPAPDTSAREVESAGEVTPSEAAGVVELSPLNPPPPGLLHRAATGLGLLALLASALLGGNLAGMRERFLGLAKSEVRSTADDGTRSPNGASFAQASRRSALQGGQPVDAPLYEPPLPSMTAPGARPVLTGWLYRVDKIGAGAVTVYRLQDGSYAVRLDYFFVAAASDLELRFSTLEAPRSTKQITDSARSPSIATLHATMGSLNFAVPDGVDLSQFRSLVIWSQIANSAYSAAMLRPV